MATLSGRPYKITPEPTPQSPHIIPSYEESISPQISLPPSLKIYYPPQTSIKIKAADPNNEIIHKNLV